MRRPRVIVSTPKDFLKIHHLTKPNDAIRMMLTFIEAVKLECAERGLPSHITVSERLPKSLKNTLIFSHHTFRDDRFRKLEDAGNEVWHFKAADLPGTMVIDRGGFSGWSSLAGTRIDDIPAEASAEETYSFFKQNHANVRAANLSKYNQPTQNGPPSEQPYVFIALQTKDDMVQNLAYLPMLDMLDMVVDRFVGTPLDVLIKRHPKCEDREVEAAIDRQLAKAPNIKLTCASIHDILAGAEAVFTVNSGVGSEALAYGLPLYCFGGADYAAAAHEIRSIEELRHTTSPLHMKLTEAEHRRFLHYYRTVYQTKIEGIRQRVAEIVGSAFKTSATASTDKFAPRRN